MDAVPEEAVAVPEEAGGLMLTLFVKSRKRTRTYAGAAPLPRTASAPRPLTASAPLPRPLTSSAPAFVLHLHLRLYLSGLRSRWTHMLRFPSLKPHGLGAAHVAILPGLYPGEDCPRQMARAHSTFMRHSAWHWQTSKDFRRQCDHLQVDSWNQLESFPTDEHDLRMATIARYCWFHVEAVLARMAAALPERDLWSFCPKVFCREGLQLFNRNNHSGAIFKYWFTLPANTTKEVRTIRNHQIKLGFNLGTRKTFVYQNK